MILGDDTGEFALSFEKPQESQKLWNYIEVECAPNTVKHAACYIHYAISPSVHSLLAAAVVLVL